jgi:hypothetical protein
MQNQARPSTNAKLFSALSSRKPFQLNGLLVPYNLAMAYLNGYIFWNLLSASIRLNYSIFCEPCRQVSSPDEMQVSCVT